MSHLFCKLNSQIWLYVVCCAGKGLGLSPFACRASRGEGKTRKNVVALGACA